MMDFKYYTLQDFSDLTASSSPAPGGGSISAMTASYAAALVCMVAELTIGKKGYENVNDIMSDLLNKADTLRKDLLDNIQKDSSSFDGYMLALKLPKNTDEEKRLRQDAMQEALKNACNVPLDVAKKSIEVLKLSKIVCEKGNKNTLSDGLVSAYMARSAALGAIQNVLINLAGIKNESFVTSMKNECKIIKNRATELENACKTTLKQ
ncbi:MAG TPA: cyclodeaminase/cyclohydrolase family protein [Christensenellaceae bacterium]|jgi:formiminotetrahydrofolate cyclodeaminase|nr:cyclodeaminase/cyclohydrolase family protein [Christensenellaceae bacterium]